MHMSQSHSQQIPNMMQQQQQQQQQQPPVHQQIQMNQPIQPIQPIQPVQPIQPMQTMQSIQPLVKAPSQPQAQQQVTAPPTNKMVPEKEERERGFLKEPLHTMEFEQNMQMRQRLNSIVPINDALLIQFLNNKLNKKATDGFFNGLYLATIDYVRNLLDELKNVCEMDNDANDMKSFMKTGSGNGATVDGEKNVLMTQMDGSGEPKAPKPYQYLVKYSAIQEDQKQIEKLDDKEQKDLEDRYTMTKDDDEDKPTKKIKKDFTEDDEVIKFLFKTKKEKNQDSENMDRKRQEMNSTLFKITSRSYTQPTIANTQDTQLQRDNAGKGRKANAMQKRVTMRHMIYLLETNVLYRRTPLLHKAYLK